MDFAFEVAEKEQLFQVYVDGGSVLGQGGQQEQFHPGFLEALVRGDVPPGDSGIDRYLNLTARSSRMLQQVDRRPASLALDVFNRPVSKCNFHSTNSIRQATIDIPNFRQEYYIRFDETGHEAIKRPPG